MIKAKICALYERLSRDDNLVGESNSIRNQKKFLEDYAVQNGFRNIRHFSDDGYSGVNFNRPGFTEMITEIEAGKIDTVIVKDMSRFGRNYLQVGFYTEMMFPKNGVRFIAVNNSIDSEKSSENDFAPFLNIMNEWYAKDTSNKIKSIFDARMKDGKRVSGSVPYGYYREKDNKQTLHIDPVSADVVRRIFTMADNGLSPQDIADKLTKDRVLIPSAYSEQYHKEQARRHDYVDPYLWGKSTVRGILDRQEYLGHTVLKKTVGTNFKLHKRRSTTDDEQYVFPYTHEAIVSEELWDSVQQKRKHAYRASPRGTHTHRLSGFLYCADCGRRLSLQTHYSKADRSRTIYSFRCSGYANAAQSCTAHGVSADALEEILLTTVQRLSRIALEDEGAFAETLQGLCRENEEARPQQLKAELHKMQKRYDELSELIKGLYENLVSGLLPERQYKQLMGVYDGEQAELEDKILQMQKELDNSTAKAPNIDKFVSLIRQYREPEEVTDSMLRELVDKIAVHEGTGSGSGRTQRIDIYFNYVGQINIAYTEEELTAFRAEEERLAAERLARQRIREKKYREERKAKKAAENGGNEGKRRVCPCCGEAFVPASNRQIFCTPDCRKANEAEKRNVKKAAENSTALSVQRNCIVCGKLFMPTHSRQKMCSEQCRRQHHSEIALDSYRKKQERERPENYTFPEKECEICGKLFWPEGSYAKVCSDDCRLEKNGTRVG